MKEKQFSIVVARSIPILQVLPSLNIIASRRGLYRSEGEVECLPDGPLAPSLLYDVITPIVMFRVSPVVC